MTWADSTVPNGSNIAFRSESETEYGRLPTYNFLATEGLLKEIHAIARSTAAYRHCMMFLAKWTRDKRKARGGKTNEMSSRPRLLY
jgi:hypothetical protein